MQNLMGEITLRFALTLPDEDHRAEEAFSRICDTVLAHVEERQIGYIVSGSFRIKDADTYPPEE